MARKINVVSDHKPTVVPAKEEKKAKLTSVIPTTPKENEIDYDLIEERESEIDELLLNFICDLAKAETDEEFDEICAMLEDLEDLKDEIETLLADRGILIYRPTIVEDKDGKEIIVNSVYGEDEPV